MTAMTEETIVIGEETKARLNRAVRAAIMLDLAYREHGAAHVQPEVLKAEERYGNALHDLIFAIECPACRVQVGLCIGKPGMARRLWNADRDLYCHIPRVRLANEYAIVLHGTNILL